MKVFAAFLAIALGLWVCGTASAAAQHLRNPDQVAPVRGHLQDMRNPDRVAPEPAIVTEPATAPAPSVASTDAIPSPDAGLRALLIVPISTGAAVAVAGAGYATTRVAHAHRRALDDGEVDLADQPAVNVAA